MTEGPSQQKRRRQLLGFLLPTCISPVHQSSMDATGVPPITITTRYLESKTPGLSALVVQVTQLVDSYMVWVGISEAGPEAKERTVAQGHLCRDWAVAMPPRPVSAR